MHQLEGRRKCLAAAVADGKWVSPTAFVVLGDRAADYVPGQRVRLPAGHGSAFELEVVSVAYATDVTTVTVKRVERATDKSDNHHASAWTRSALAIHSLMACLEARRASSDEPGIIHTAARYELMWGWLFSRTDNAVIRRLEIRPGERVLDLGCGPGGLTRAVADAVESGEAVGLDASPEMIARATRKVRSLPLTFTSGQAERLPFADSTFDAIVSRLLLHELPAESLPAALAEMRRVLKPGGRALLIDLPGAALDHALAELGARGIPCDTGTVGFPFFQFVAFRTDR